jgi:hypothetical protein
LPEFLFNLHAPVQTLKPTRSFSLLAGLLVSLKPLAVLIHISSRVAGAEGIEPSTFGFGDRRSAN